MKKLALIVTTLIISLLFLNKGIAQDIVDPSTMNNKIMAGYQGWFGAAGDGSGYSWIHWSRGSTPNPENITFDMWPDMREYGTNELFETEFVYSDLSNAGLFSSYVFETVDRHVLWMKDYGIDGVFVQRFISSALSRTDQRDTVLQNVRRAAENHGRVFANMYDMSGGNPESFAQDVINDWMHLVDDLKITESPNYLHHNGLPVLSLWGVNAGGSKDILTAEMWAELLQWFTVDAAAKYRVTLKAGVDNAWQSDSPSWQAVYDNFHFISPWAVGRYSNNAGADNYRNQYFEADLTETASRGMEYIPVVFPGFSWANLYPGRDLNQIPRRGGDFLWHQFYNAVDAGCNMVYVAMYDEVDEGTAIFKLAENKSQIPTKGNFVTLDMDGIELPSDWYLKLTGEASKMLRGEVPLTSTIPLVPFPDNSEFIAQDVPTIMDPGVSQTVSITLENSGITSWTASDTFKLVDLVSETATWGISEIELGAAETIAPGESKTFSFDITAPATEGVYKFQWQMTRDSIGLFGDDTEIRLINVSSLVNFLDDCDALTEWDPAASLTLNSADQKQGTSCIEFNGGINDSVEFQKVFAPAYNSGITAYDAVLQFWYYVSDASLIEDETWVQLGSGGALGADTYSWTLTDLETGWNLISLNIRDAETSGSPDLNAINWFNLTNPKTGDALSRIDEIQVFDMYAGATKYQLTVNDGTGDGSYIENEIIPISADEAPPAQRFIGWGIDSGDPVIEDVNAENTSLKMSASDVEISALYKVLGIYLDDCDLLKDWGSHGPLSLNTTDQQEGLACLEFSGANTDEFKKSFSTPYNSGATVENGRLQFWYYVSDPTRMEAGNQVELGSAGRNDQNEFNWDIGALNPGWNFISLEFSEADTTEGVPDLSAINWFRLYHVKSDSVLTRIDAIEIVDPTAGARYPLTVYNGSGDGNYYSGIEINISAEAAPEGMMFAFWEINSGNPDIANVNAPSTTLTMPAGDVIITANYTEIQQYTLTVNFGSGSGSYIPGETVTLFASGGPAGYVFEKWVIDSGSPTIANVNSPFTTLTMSAEDAVVTGTFRDPSVGIVTVNDYDQSLNIYPNPAQTEIHVEIKLEKPTEMNVSIFDLQGREVGSGIKKTQLVTGNNVLTIPVSALETGTYLIKIITDSRVYSELVVIQ